MTGKKSGSVPYSFEQGPIRPPAEANSLLLRLTRNCPWNRCTFCPLYKGKTFSVRSMEHIMRDIDTAWRFVCAFNQACDRNGGLTRPAVDQIAQAVPAVERPLFNAALHWFAAGMRAIFFQDADSLIVKPADLIEILRHIHRRFPEVERITTFGRTRTILRIKDQDLKTYAELGLNRVHAGLETGSDKILGLVKKGCTKQMHIEAGHKLQHAGIELSECVLLGLGGKNLAREHALETADAVNRINPPIIRFLTLAAPRGVEMYPDDPSESYLPSTDLDIAKETELFIAHLDGVTSYLESNNVLNLLQEVEGVMPNDRQKMLNVLKTFIDLPDDIRMLFQIGKRLRIFSGLSDLNDPDRLKAARQICTEHGIHHNNADQMIREMIQNFI